jgi:hypothetical protein
MAFVGFAGKIESRRADSNADLLITSEKKGVAETCTGLRTPLTRPVSLPQLARYCSHLLHRTTKDSASCSAVIISHCLFAMSTNTLEDRVPVLAGSVAEGEGLGGALRKALALLVEGVLRQGLAGGVKGAS